MEWQWHWRVSSMWWHMGLISNMIPCVHRNIPISPMRISTSALASQKTNQTFTLFHIIRWTVEQNYRAMSYTHTVYDDSGNLKSPLFTTWNAVWPCNWRFMWALDWNIKWQQHRHSIHSLTANTRQYGHFQVNPDSQTILQWWNRIGLRHCILVERVRYVPSAL